MIGRRDWRKVALFAVMIGALALTVRGEVSAVAPLLGVGFGVVMALVFAVSTLVALNYVIDGTGPVRRWAWAVLVFAGGMELGLSTWHSVTSVLLDQQGRPVLVDGHTVPALPLGAAVAVGAGPVLLAALLSHLVSLSMTLPADEVSAAPVEHRQPTPVRYSAERHHDAVRTSTDPSGTDQPAALAAGTATPENTSDGEPADTATARPAAEQYRPTSTDQNDAAPAGTDRDGTDGSQPTAWPDPTTDRMPRVVWGDELWERACRTARDYHAQHGSHVRVDDIQALGIGRNRAVALRRDVLAHLLSHPAA
ncbi:hypothetical protein ACFV4N_08405 [Actinosynnema sp. NPDC059797]